MINVAILGYGVVGSGTARLIKHNASKLKDYLNDDITVKKIIDIRKFQNDEFESIISDNFDTVLNDDEIKIVAETIGGQTVAYKYTKALLEKGKSVVTSNKELVAEKGDELLQIAAANNCHYLFEASVGGAIPIINTLTTSLQPNNITKIIGILNGTTNYILTEMFQNSLSFEEALANAQNLGYAERNPDADIKGIDAQRKIAILSDIAWGLKIDPNLVPTRGIDFVTQDIIDKAASINCVIKLICYAEKIDDRICIFVSPCAINKNSVIANINGVFNGVVFSCDYADDILLSGRGAGSNPTASAVVSDIAQAYILSPRKKPLWKKGNVILADKSICGFKYLDNTEIPIIK